VIEETFPATAARGLACLKALNTGIDFERHNGGTVSGVCGCGHPVVTRSFEGAYNAMRDHFTRQVEQ
jgi:hypothetical protein